VEWKFPYFSEINTKTLPKTFGLTQVLSRAYRRTGGNRRITEAAIFTRNLLETFTFVSSWISSHISDFAT